MYRTRMAGMMLGLLILSSGCATCRTPRCSKPDRACKPCKTDCDSGACRKEKCDGVLVPYRNACQSRDLSHNWLGRLVRWATYRPLCANTPCDCAESPRCHPPLYTYFEPSKYNRCYEPVDCGGGACRSCFFGGIFRRNKCGTCKDKCADDCGGWTLKISLPRISFCRNGGDCNTGCKDNACCGTKCMALPRPISNRACENSSAGCKDAGCGSGCGLGSRLGLRGGCGSCGLRGRLGNNVNNKCCSTDLNVYHGDLNNLPILGPKAVTEVKPGDMKLIPPAEVPAKVADEVIPVPKQE